MAEAQSIRSLIAKAGTEIFKQGITCDYLLLTEEDYKKLLHEVREYTNRYDLMSLTRYYTLSVYSYPQVNVSCIGVLPVHMEWRPDIGMPETQPAVKIPMKKFDLRTHEEIL